MHELLLAMYQAPRCSGFHGVARTVDHRPAQIEAARRQGSSVASLGGIDLVEGSFEVWLAADSRCRVDCAGHISLWLGDDTIRCGPGGEAIREPVSELSIDPVPSVWWRPRRLLSALEIDEVSDSTAVNRACWKVIATAGPERNRFLGLLLPGDKFTLWIDQATGVVLRAVEELDDGRPVSETIFDVFEPDSDIPDSVFDRALPDHAVVRTPIEVMRERAEAHGVDLTGVDIDDVQQMARLVYPSPGSVESMLDQHVATGPPPDDVRAATADIATAFEAFGQRTGGDLTHIEAGEGLASVIDDLAQRFSSPLPSLTVRRTKFVDSTNAVVQFGIINADGHAFIVDQLGHVVLDSGRWKVRRHTFAALASLAGVNVPTPTE